MKSIYEAEKALLAVLFRHYPDRLVWVGGSMLQLLEHSPRASFDVDLIPLEPISPAELVGVVKECMERLGALVGLEYSVTIDGGEPDFVRLRIRASDGGAFTLDLTRMPGLPNSTITVLLDSLLGAAAVRVPTLGVMLVQKWRALLLRRYAKPGDLFDVWFLLSKGVVLTSNEELALHDEIEAAEVDIAERFAALQRSGWAQALTKSGVEGLTPDTARLMLERVRQEAAKL